MNQIDLFSGGGGEEKKQQVTQSKSKLKSKRPQQINVQKVISQNQKWRQCKIIGKNLTIRSYSASCHFQNKFYVYGGYQILNGMMSDFYSIELQDSQQKYNWNQIQCKGKKPGSRSKHALIGGKQKIFLIGGLCDNILSSNQIFAFDPKTQHWQNIKPEGVSLPHIDSFGHVYLEDNGQQKVIIIGGYDGGKAQFMNAVYQYNITRNKLSILFEGSQNQNPNIPIPRCGCAAETDGKNVFLFGGKDAQNRMNDIWAFSLTSFKYQKLQPKGHIPAERNGHSMNLYQGKLYIFGGIHDITWQLDDLQIYDIKKNEWTTLQQDSPRKIQKKKVHEEKAKQKDKSGDKRSPKKKNWYDTVNTLYNKNSSADNSPMRKNFSTTYKEDENNGHSPGKMIDEQRKKAFMQRKNQMLKNFQTTKEEKTRYVKLETSSQAMKNSLDVIGNPDPKIKIPQGRLTDFGKESVSKFLAPLSNNSNLIVGKKPCARDGHSSVIINNELIIFGGDRHQMSFNDIYKLNLSIAEKELPN